MVFQFQASMVCSISCDYGFLCFLGEYVLLKASEYGVLNISCDFGSFSSHATMAFHESSEYAFLGYMRV